jgi:Neprosin
MAESRRGRDPRRGSTETIEAIGQIERNPEGEDEARGADQPDRIPTDAEQRAAAAQRVGEIRQFLEDHYNRRQVVTQTRTPGGQLLDWVPIESQLDGGRLADPPSESLRLAPDRSATERADELVTFELARPDAKLGPPGTVPLPRRDLDRIRSTKSLNDYLSKDGWANRIVRGPAGSRLEYPEAGGTHKYAYTAQSGTCYGTEGNINAWDPYVEWSDEFSLGQLALSRGSGSGLQTVEVGHQEYRDLYGDWVPHLFVFYTTNGYTSQGDNMGGYNQDVRGWVQYSSRIYPEALSTPVSVFGGTQYVMGLKVQLWQGNWWVRVNGEWIGYYPASLFSTSGLRSQADEVDWYGEIVDSDSHAGTTATDMGNGHWPYEGWQHCAYMNNLLYQSSADGSMQPYNGSSWASHPKCYGIETHFAESSSWGRYFWWGGSGKNSQCP